MQTQEVYEQLQAVAKWIMAHDAGPHVASVCPQCESLPKVYLHNLLAMQNLFPGQIVDRERCYESFIYTIEQDDIEFSTSGPIDDHPATYDRITL